MDHGALSVIREGENGGVNEVQKLLVGRIHRVKGGHRDNSMVRHHHID